jgi:Rad3-related DNA helicase
VFDRFDLSGRLPRPAQKAVLEWLKQVLPRSPIIAIQGPTGLGKDAILRAIQVELGGHTITISNSLLDQKHATYPDVPILKGSQLYDCHNNEALTCGDVKTLGKKLCSDCPYRLARKGCREGAPTIANPASYYYASLVPGFQQPEILTIDEAHRLYDMALLFVDCALSVEDYAVPKSIVTLLDFSKWAESAIKKAKQDAEEFLKAGTIERGASKAKQAARLRDIDMAVRATPENFVIYRESRLYRRRKREYLCIRPLSAPPSILNQIMNGKKIILVSATLFRSDIERLFPGRHYEYLDLASPIPKQNRPVYLSPVAPKVNKDLPPNVVADWIREWRRKFPDRNTIVHVSYAWAERLRPFFAPEEALFNTKEGKDDAIALFKKDGGLFIASGCAEGVDFPGEQCRLNLIPVLYRENLGDAMVQKRLALPGGKRAYDLETLKTTIQQTGRSTRGPDDESITIVGDPMFARLINTYRNDLPASFIEAICWGKRP